MFSAFSIHFHQLSALIYLNYFFDHGFKFIIKITSLSSNVVVTKFARANLTSKTFVECLLISGEVIYLS